MRRLLTSFGACCLFLLVPSSAAWAAHPSAPVPSLAPGQGLVGTGWSCHREETAIVTGSTSTQDCQISGWATTPAPAAYPTHPPSPDVQPVSVVGPLPPIVVSSVSPVLRVREQSPPPPANVTYSDSRTVSLCTPAAGPSPSPSPADPSPSPSASPAPTSDDDAACAVKLADRQWLVAGLFAGTGLMLGLVVFVRREAVGFLR